MQKSVPDDVLWTLFVEEVGVRKAVPRRSRVCIFLIGAIASICAQHRSYLIINRGSISASADTDFSLPRLRTSEPEEEEK